VKKPKKSKYSTQDKRIQRGKSGRAGMVNRKKAQSRKCKKLRLYIKVEVGELGRLFEG